MKPIQFRFETISDPANGWIVWDNDADFPASFGGESLHGLTRFAAEQFARILNELYPPRAMPISAEPAGLFRH